MQLLAIIAAHRGSLMHAVSQYHSLVSIMGGMMRCDITQRQQHSVLVRPLCEGLVYVVHVLACFVPPGLIDTTTCFIVLR